LKDELIPGKIEKSRHSCNLRSVQGRICGHL